MPPSRLIFVPIPDPVNSMLMKIRYLLVLALLVALSSCTMNKKDAMMESLKIRTRPVLMTAFAVSVGMLPVAQGAAIGLERLAPLGTVAIGGLIVGTFMTLVFIPQLKVFLITKLRL